jgi:hypothetical protein
MTTLTVRRTSGTRRTQPRLAARRGDGTRHNRMVAHASAGSEPAEGFDVEGNGLWGRVASREPFPS